MNASATFLETADRIGARICRDAIWDGGRCNWVAGYEARVGKDGVDYQALDPSLYRGTSGIALFLARLARATGERIFGATADGARRQALSQEDRLQADKGNGLYSGLAGVAFALSQCGETFFPEAVTLAHAAFALPAGPQQDLIEGAAGVVVTALHFYRATGDRTFLDAAARHGETLLPAARRSGNGWSWPTLLPSAQPGRPDLNGFAHGAAGIAWALLELWHATGETKFRTAAEEGFRYEQSRFSAGHGNWPDLRDRFYQNPATRYSTMWCHGAAGIAFSRLRAAQLTGEPQYREQAQVALDAVERGLPSWGNCCLCHGLFGSIDLLLYADTPRQIELAHGVALAAMDQYAERRLPWPCGVPGSHETPDLMLGLAGIGHTLLRLTDPAAFPSPLMVDC